MYMHVCSLCTCLDTYMHTCIDNSCVYVSMSFVVQMSLPILLSVDPPNQPNFTQCVSYKNGQPALHFFSFVSFTLEKNIQCKRKYWQVVNLGDW